MSVQKKSRRTFLKQGAALGAAVAAPMIVPSTVFGKNAPSNRVNIANIGVGGRGTSLLGRFVEIPGVQYVAVCDCFKARREDMRDKLNVKYGSNVVTAYQDFREVLAREDVDAVVVATQDHWHVPIAIAAARAGKDMYVEKPLGTAMEWAWKLRELIKKNKNVFQYGTQQRSAPQFLQACELARNGYLGEIRKVDAWCSDAFPQLPAFTPPPYGTLEEMPIPEGLDYDMWVGPAPLRPYTGDRCKNIGTYHIYDYALGFIAGWGAHPLDIAQWGLDADNTSPVKYEGTGSLPPKGRLMDTIVGWDMECEYANGVKLHFMSHRVAEPYVTQYREMKDHGTTFFGDEGWVSVDRSGIHASDPKLLEIKFGPNDQRLINSPHHQANLIDCIRNRKTPISSLEAAIRSDTISHLSDIAIRQEKVIHWDPKKEQIIDDAAASTMLDRPLRAPWDLDKKLIS